MEFLGKRKSQGTEIEINHLLYKTFGFYISAFFPKFHGSDISFNANKTLNLPSTKSQRSHKILQIVDQCPKFIAMAAKILANLIIMGSGIVLRGVVQAYRQALHNASKTGVAQETLQNAVRRGSKALTEQEARQILGVTEQSSWAEIAQKYDKLFERNATSGSFYLQSKVHRAKECLETVYQPKNQPGGPMG